MATTDTTDTVETTEDVAAPAPIRSTDPGFMETVVEMVDDETLQQLIRKAVTNYRTAYTELSDSVRVDPMNVVLERWLESAGEDDPTVKTYRAQKAAIDDTLKKLEVAKKQLNDLVHNATKEYRPNNDKKHISELRKDLKKNADSLTTILDLALGEGHGIQVVSRVNSGLKVTTDSAIIRQWAQSQGMDISDRGRIPEDIEEAYRKAHK